MFYPTDNRKWYIHFSHTQLLTAPIISRLLLPPLQSEYHTVQSRNWYVFKGLDGAGRAGGSKIFRLWVQSKGTAHNNFRSLAKPLVSVLHYCLCLLCIVKAPIRRQPPICVRVFTCYSPTLYIIISVIHHEFH
jgi:hypothetical protein